MGLHTLRNYKRYFATAPSGMHPLGNVCLGLLPGKTELRVWVVLQMWGS
jgi:hypothetical protein